MNHEEMLNFLLEFLSSNNETLEDIQQDIIRGSLQGMTYETMQPQYSTLRYRSIETIKKIDAPKLWQKLTNIFIKAEVLDPKKEKVGKKNLIIIIERLINGSERKPKSIVINNQYQVIDTLQKHDLETIYLAYNLHLLNKPKCVVKQLENASPRSTKKLERQARVLENLGTKSDRVPQLYAYFQAENYFYLISEYLEGQPLSKVINNTPWSESEVILFLQDVLEILDLVHQNNAIHRCITPDNLICQESDKRIALVNFDAVKCLDISSNFTSAITVNNYAAPELIIAPQPCSDLYSLGKIAIQLLSALPPKQLRVNPHTLDIVLPDNIRVNSHFATILQRMTCYDFKQRYQSAREILEIL
ncbi:putative Serine/threonine protein kinase [Hyella patelloides LEGE 07179]|uniref:non-specific serine/threonine protein kinase n=1 Tax=Hyella patelloides LEGE 07179 TaxID=945734 RepID=A0A563W223_9CYAN|nr:protein kinase [Hyella patelloides]VEP17583.1 putative Serine/threonine protein kinase [Hyella patelloides LEGE 07179]